MSSIKETTLEGERVIFIPLSELHPFPDHPFKVRDDDAMTETIESVMEYGVLAPAIVRPRQEGGYEIVAGHRRKRACEVAGLANLPAIVRDLDDDMATILMVDSNIQRENILPSEKAQAYKMKLDAIKRQGMRTDLTSRQVVGKLTEAADIVGSKVGESGRQVQRYIRLTELSPQLQQMVDEKKIPVTPAVELSHLRPEEQQLVAETIVKSQSVPTLAQAQQLKKLSQSGGLDNDALRSVMAAEKEQETHSAAGVAQKTSALYHPRDAPQEVLAGPKAEISPSEVPFQLKDKCYATFQESVNDLKNTEKDCSCTPDIFLAAVTAFVKRFRGEISEYEGEYYAPIFPALSPLQLQYLRQQMDTIRNAADQLYTIVERKNECE